MKSVVALESESIGLAWATPLPLLDEAPFTTSAHHDLILC